MIERVNRRWKTREEGFVTTQLLSWLLFVFSEEVLTLHEHLCNLLAKRGFLSQQIWEEGDGSAWDLFSHKLTES